MSSYTSAFWVVVTAFLWGATDPLLKHFGKKQEKKSTEEEEENDEESNVVWRSLKEVLLLFGNWRYSLSFLANQLGSVTFILALVNSEISVAVPAANGLKFVFNLAVGRRLGEGRLSPKAVLGLVLVLTGTVMHYLS